MATTDPGVVADPQNPTIVVKDFPLTLNEFCSRLSATDKRVELIGGFEHTERFAGRMKDVQSAYSDRFTAFANQPA